MKTFKKIFSPHQIGAVKGIYKSKFKEHTSAFFAAGRMTSAKRKNEADCGQEQWRQEEHPYRAQNVDK